eukprot:gnl/MRDRNA2_/MRDRNA2_236487_c0_seq1.p1 gnl/MRDRNA2_/MRDRNA2_236487_c0~~gnl/MRDRNA2_/MRDRNA2_236487_c0_seq1.p1  ORF type:complete len:297 (+),score=50.72 gnl/MRDRNA2_/MRDRNA2_236487_c0_seq1:29-892(+)
MALKAWLLHHTDHDETTLLKTQAGKHLGAPYTIPHSLNQVAHSSRPLRFSVPVPCSLPFPHMGKEHSVDRSVSAAVATDTEIPNKVSGGTFIDTKAMLAASTFKIKPDDLIALAKTVLAKGVGLEDPDVLAENFEFVAPVVGPLPKDEFITALKGFDLLQAFPDLDSRFYNFHVDPFEFNRVWYMVRPIATHTGPLFGKDATGIKIEQPPQANSLMFNEEGKVTQFTTGYVMDRRVGNTGGLGAAFGYFYGTGNALPFPECQPYKQSFRFRAFNWLGRLASSLQKKT